MQQEMKALWLKQAKKTNKQKKTMNFTFVC